MKIKKARDLCPGDKVNGHEQGWLIVSTVGGFGVDGTKVVFTNGSIAIFYPRFESLAELAPGIYDFI